MEMHVIAKSCHYILELKIVLGSSTVCCVLQKKNVPQNLVALSLIVHLNVT
jgi:hypothetical protein